jgi:hypothetical protein
MREHKPPEIVRKAKEAIAAQRQSDFEFNMAAARLIGDLRYPVSRDGSILDLTFFAPLIAYHLVRCGYRIVPDKQQIKPRRLDCKGVTPDAVEWVPMDAPDDPLANLANMTMAQINRLPPVQRAIAMRRINGSELPELPPNPGWHVATNIKIEDSPDLPDGKQWTGRKNGR